MESLFTQHTENNGVQVFSNPDFENVRVIGTPDNPLFCLADVCRVLNLRSGDVRQRLDKGVVITHTLSTNGGNQQVNFINEDGLYDAILDSRKPSARKFRKWITSEVLPTIRRNGAYATPQTIEAILANPDNAIKLLTTLKEEREKNRQLQQKNKALAYEAEYALAVLQSPSNYTITQVAKDVGYRSAISLTQKLVDAHILYRQSGQYLPFSRYADSGYFATRTSKYVRADGSVGTEIYTVFTEKGRMWMHYLKDRGKI